MTLFRSFVSSLLFFSNQTSASDSLQIKGNDSLTLAQAYVKLIYHLLKNTSFRFSISRISKILPYEENELKSIKDTAFIKAKATLYHFTYALFHFNQAKLQFKNRPIATGKF